MPSPFVVTVVPTSLSLTPGSQNGSFDVTVSNKSTRAVTVRAVRVVDPRTAQDWLQPRDRDEFPLAIGETKKVTYGVNVPANATPQVVKCRWDFVDVANPDEFFTQGPTAAITVQKVEVKVITPWWKKALPFAIAALVLIGVGFGIMKILGGKKSGVPYVVGMDFSAAEGALKGAKLTAVRSDTLAADTVKFRQPGMVVTQFPDSGPTRPTNDTVRVTVQRAWAVVPPVQGVPYQQASELIAMQGLFARPPGTVATTDATQNNKVQSTVPGARSLVAKGDSVGVTIFAMARCSPWPRCNLLIMNIFERANATARTKVHVIVPPRPHQ